MKPIRVFVSSTWHDLGAERKAIRDALSRMRELQGVGMEFFGGRDEAARETSVEEVKLCDAYIGVFAQRYGSGITWQEYQCAHEHGLPCFIYFKDEAFADPSWRETDPELTHQLMQVKDTLRARHLTQKFAKAEELATLVVTDLHRWLAHDQGVRPRLLRYVAHLLASADFHEWQRYFALRVSAEGKSFEVRMRMRNHPPSAQSRGRTTYSVDEAITKFRRLAIVGEPGSGKTTALKHIALRYAHEYQQHESIGAPPSDAILPVFVWLPRFNSMSAPTPYHRILLLVQDSLSRHSVVVQQAELETLLKGTRVLLLLDGLNELGESNTELFLDGLATFASTHPRVMFVTTSRTHDFQGLAHDYPVLELIELEYPHGVEEYLRCYLHDSRDVARIFHALEKSMPLRHLSLNPLLLMLIVVVYTRTGMIPESRGSLLQEIAFGLLGGWRPSARSGTGAMGVADTKNYWVGDKHAALERLGYEMRTLGLEIKRTEVLEILRSTYAAHKPVARTDRPRHFAPLDISTNWNKLADEIIGDRVLEEIKQLGSSAIGSLIRFWHQTMQEYFAAAYICEEVHPLIVSPRSGSPSRRERRAVRRRLHGYLRNSQWHEIIAIVACLLVNQPARLAFSPGQRNGIRFIEHVWKVDKLLAAMCIANTQQLHGLPYHRYVRTFRRKLLLWGVYIPRLFPWVLFATFLLLLWGAPLRYVDSFDEHMQANFAYPNLARYAIFSIFSVLVGALVLASYLRCWVAGAKWLDRLASSRFIRPTIRALKMIRSEAAVRVLNELAIKTRDDFAVGDLTRSAIIAGKLRSPRTEDEIVLLLRSQETVLEGIEGLGNLATAKALHHLAGLLDRADLDTLAYSSAVLAIVRVAKARPPSDGEREMILSRLQELLAEGRSYSRRLCAYQALLEMGVNDVEPPVRGGFIRTMTSTVGIAIITGLLLAAAVVLLRQYLG